MFMYLAAGGDFNFLSCLAKDFCVRFGTKKKKTVSCQEKMAKAPIQG
jgi:hypothetical protein